MAITTVRSLAARRRLCNIRGEIQLAPGQLGLLYWHIESHDMKKKLEGKSKHHLFCCIAALAISLLASSAAGQSVMQLMPPVQEVRVQRGRTEHFTVSILNTGDQDVPSKFTVYDMDITVDGRPFIADSGYARGCGQWITLEPSDVIIKGHETMVLHGSIQAPRDTEGGYYAAIKGTFVGTSISLDTERANIEGSQIGVESQAMVVVLVTVPSSRCKPIIIPDTLFVFPSGQGTSGGSTGRLNFNTDKGWQVVMPVRNDGNIHTRIAGQVSFYSESGTPIESAPLQAGKGYLLPGRTRNLEANGKNVLADGYYMMRIALQTTEGSGMSRSFPFAVYKGETYPGATTEELSGLIRASSPGFLLKDPLIQRTITPGGSSYLVTQMTNTVGETLMVIPRKMEWNVNETGQPVLGNDTKLQPRSCTSWIEFEEDEIVLLPGKRKSVKFKIHSPEDIAGAYYSAIVFDTDRSRPELPAEFMAPRTQLIAVTTAKELSYEVAIDTISVKKERAKDITLYRFFFTVRNTGNVHCFTKGSMSFEKGDARGVYKRVGETHDFGDAQTHILPGGARRFEIDVPNMESGQYRIILATNYNFDTQPFVKYQTVSIK